MPEHLHIFTLSAIRMSSLWAGLSVRPSMISCTRPGSWASNGAQNVLLVETSAVRVPS